MSMGLAKAQSKLETDYFINSLKNLAYKCNARLGDSQEGLVYRDIINLDKVMNLLEN